MLFYKDGRSILNYQLAYNKLLDEMKNENNSNYDAELVLFITNPLYQGKGYGKALLNNFHNYMQNGRLLLECSLQEAFVRIFLVLWLNSKFHLLK